MAEIKNFLPAKLICGLMAAEEIYFKAAEDELVQKFGPVDRRSPFFTFDCTAYYAREMGPGLKRSFLSFAALIDPSELSRIKIETNQIEERLRVALGAEKRIINIDPGILTPAALIMATAKNFSHRIPLQHGIYAHLELLFSHNAVKTLDWTYPDFRQDTYYPFLLQVRKDYLSQIKQINKL